MKKQCIDKLSLFLMGLTQRITDNAAFFKHITATYKAGTKDFTANIMLSDKKLKVNFIGNTEVCQISELPGKLSDYAVNYESVSVIYEERGLTIYIDADNKNVSMKTRDNAIDNTVKPNNETSKIGNRDYLIKIGQADTLLKEIGIIGANGKVKNDMIRKYNQIDHFVELISDMLKELAARYESLTILDCGCGKSYLTFVLNYYIKEVLKKPCRFIGLDNSEIVIEASKKTAANLSYNNMDFIMTDIEGYSANEDIHLVISLHACDTATDKAIALAVRNNAKAMVMVPCCHRELLSQYSYEPFEQILKHGILKARIADALTDGMRTLFLESLGYETSIVEYISPLETPKNLMIRAQKTKAPDKKALAEYEKLKKALNIDPTLQKLLF